jgi:Domain of unknown function (DUF4062)
VPGVPSGLSITWRLVRGHRPARVIVVAVRLRTSLGVMSEMVVIHTADQWVRVFVSSTLSGLAAGRQAVRDAVTRLRLVPVMFDLGARHRARP